MQKLRFLSLAVSCAMVAMLDAKKVTKDFLESEIAETKYTRISPRTTHCLITTHSGVEFTGESTVADESNFDEELGKQYAYQQAFESMYEPYGFLLRYITQNKAQSEDEIEGKPVFDLSDLASTEIDHDTLVGQLAEQTGDLIEWLGKTGYTDQRWLNIAKTDLQKGFMSLMRSVTKPSNFAGC